ncbi:hypothetical protein P7C73_g308, partial [Tremellales sp. Uapishka_1]
MAPFFPTLADLRTNLTNMFEFGDAPVAGPSKPSSPALGTMSTARPSDATIPSRTTNLSPPLNERRPSAGSVVIVEDENGAMRELGKAIKGKGRPVSVGSGFNDDGHGSRRGRRKAPVETFIIVRPPPTASKNPMNLQIQLVMKSNRRERSESGFVSLRSPSVSTTADDIPATPIIVQPANEIADSPTDLDQPLTAGVVSLNRSASLKSTESAGSVNSIGTGSTSSLGGGSGKRIVPLYNLAVHNMMPTVVSDAGTDSKVAKFLKRTVDIAGVGILEPSEVWLPPSTTSSASNLHPLSNLDDPHSPSHPRPHSMISFTHPLSPTSTRVGDEVPPPRSSMRNSLDLKKFRMDGFLATEPGREQEAGAKKFFGKMFKKKNAQESNLPIPKSPSASFSDADSHSTPPPNPNLMLKPPLTSPASTTPELLHHHLGQATFGTAPVVIARRSSGTMVTSNGAVTGLTASINSSPIGLGLNGTSLSIDGSAETFTPLPITPSSRPVGYTWTVRRWAKKNQEGWAAHLVAAAAAGIEMVGSHSGLDDGENDVVFEWVKLKPAGNGLVRSSTRGTLARSRTRSKARNQSLTVGRQDLSSDSANHSVTSLNLRAPSPSSPNPDAKSSSRRRTSPSISPSRATSISFHEETEEESDPEDSETPWTCSVWVKKTNHRQLLGTLTPAPHHPKVVGVLNIPTELLPVSLAGETRGRGTREHEVLAQRIKDEVALTEENLKDVVCVTAMWLVAREEFGGLGRKKAARGSPAGKA